MQLNSVFDCGTRNCYAIWLLRSNTTYFLNTFLNKFIIIIILDLKRQYVVYPPEGPRPPSPEEVREMARELARKRDNIRWWLYGPVVLFGPSPSNNWLLM